MNATTAKNVRLESVRKRHFLREVVPDFVKKVAVTVSRPNQARIRFMKIHFLCKGRPVVVTSDYPANFRQPITVIQTECL